MQPVRWLSLHFTVATKQPAMTAAALAATVQHQKGSKTAQIAELAALIINIIRTQFCNATSSLVELSK